MWSTNLITKKKVFIKLDLYINILSYLENRYPRFVKLPNSSTKENKQMIRFDIIVPNLNNNQ